MNIKAIFLLKITPFDFQAKGKLIARSYFIYFDRKQKSISYVYQLLYKFVAVPIAVNANAKPLFIFFF